MGKLLLCSVIFGAQEVLRPKKKGKMTFI